MTALRVAGRLALIWLTCALVSFVHWMQVTLGEVSLGQIVFHWRYLGGSGSIAKIAAVDFVVHCVAWPLAAAVLITWIERRMIRPWLQRDRQPVRRKWLPRLTASLPALVIAASLATLASRTSAVQFLGPMSAHDYFAAHYVPPAEVKLTPDKRKNLVLIYVESLESAYLRPDIFGRDLLASLTDLHPHSFEAYEQLPGTGYTIAALVSTQCAAPLQMVGFLDWRDQGERARDFLPGAVCLGDILAAQGYHNVFMGGASLSFSGKGKFLQEHHFHEVYGRAEWAREGIPKSRMSGWGLHDDDLFEQAKLKLRRLHEAGQPFSLTLLTVDSHWPAGYLSEGCRKRGAEEFDGIVECTAKMVADLVRFVRVQGYDEDTNIVVIGDHLTPPNSLSSSLARVQKRTIYNAFFARSIPKPNRATVVHFDMLPTILDFIGLHAEGGRAGLGFSAFGPASVPFPTARSRIELGEHVLTPSKAYLALWEPAPVQGSVLLGSRADAK